MNRLYRSGGSVFATALSDEERGESQSTKPLNIVYKAYKKIGDCRFTTARGKFLEFTCYPILARFSGISEPQVAGYPWALFPAVDVFLVFKEEHRF